jgi:hypothetical protein
VWDDSKKARCEACSCFDPWYFCVVTDAPADKMKKAGYAPLPQGKAATNTVKGR